ncbi:MAG: EF2563 family selenium-dependent molybdenum hydroxylase system protein [Gracilibacteraceae bacterium]|jgi:xanthine dehydrogenase accessory factor|nr:EF2563 family selenium-dependent molybdenum hydroxylase system protein [Gracilibacteraceae bacterium]
MFKNTLIVVKGAGDVASGVAWRLFRCGFPLVMTEIASPTVVRRRVAFAEAVYDGAAMVEGVEARLITQPEQAALVLADNQIPVIVDPAAELVQVLQPQIVVDAIMAKRNLGTGKKDANLVVGLGPGFVAGRDCHAVIETKRGPALGRAIWAGAAEPDTAVPGSVNGYTVERVFRSPATGLIKTLCDIGDTLRQGDIAAQIEKDKARVPVLAPFDGVIRGLLRNDSPVFSGMKIGDIDPRLDSDLYYRISDKALAIAGGVLEAILTAKSIIKEVE